MLTLRSSPASPFVRKVRIAANVLGLERDIAVEPADTMNPSDSVRRQNPLGKIAALVLEDILEYLDHRAGGGRIVPNDAGARFSALRLQALADGLMDASILLIYEARWRRSKRRRRRSPRHPMWVRSRSPARSATAISASRERGGAIIRGWSPGSTNSPRACRPSPRPSRRARPAFSATN